MTKARPCTDRREFLRLSAAAAASVSLSCSHSSQSARPTLLASAGNGSAGSGVSRKVLLVFFSRAGENYFNGGRKVLKVGNTEVVADFIRDALGCDVFTIRAVEPYSDRYDPTVERNVREQTNDARPGIIALPVSIGAYDTVVIGSPIWNVRVPRIMLTFVEHFDFSGKTVHPFTTYAMSGLGHAVEEYKVACRGATTGAALAVKGEDAESSRPDVEAWLRQIGLLA